MSALENLKQQQQPQQGALALAEHLSQASGEIYERLEALRDRLRGVELKSTDAPPWTTSGGLIGNLETAGRKIEHATRMVADLEEIIG